MPTQIKTIYKQEASAQSSKVKGRRDLIGDVKLKIAKINKEHDKFKTIANAFPWTKSQILNAKKDN